MFSFQHFFSFLHLHNFFPSQPCTQINMKIILVFQLFSFLDRKICFASFSWNLNGMEIVKLVHFSKDYHSFYLSNERSGSRPPQHWLINLHFILSAYQIIKKKPKTPAHIVRLKAFLGLQVKGGHVEAPFSLQGGQEDEYIHTTAWQKKVQFFSPRVCIIFIHVDENCISTGRRE